ncbi:CAP domain-containing protein [Gymnodinialimonas sp. 2305UL16-5]|uniref:CAP domain-containing protein n=1 Tax=Gymnodinialimonas mytili TaxID=3126503 RepID=UPI00309FDEC8
MAPSIAAGRDPRIKGSPANPTRPKQTAKQRGKMMSQANAAELLMLSFINEERTARGLDSLDMNNRLNESSEEHSQWMLETDTFAHRGDGGSSATQRIQEAEYDLEGSWRTAENIGWQSERGAPGIEDDVRDIHASLMNSPGHRANILNPELEDIGIGIEVGAFDGFEAVMVTQNFATSDADNGVTAPELPDDTLMSELDLADVPSDLNDTSGLQFDTVDRFDFADLFNSVDQVDLTESFSGQAFTGTISANGETVTIDDPAEFERLSEGLFELLRDMSMNTDCLFV